jgi:hypothetical protein
MVNFLQYLYDEMIKKILENKYINKKNKKKYC